MQTKFKCESSDQRPNELDMHEHDCVIAFNLPMVHVFWTSLHLWFQVKGNIIINIGRHHLYTKNLLLFQCSHYVPFSNLNSLRSCYPLPKKYKCIELGLPSLKKKLGLPGSFSLNLKTTFYNIDSPVTPSDY